jgi:ankyrin repeat protein
LEEKLNTELVIPTIDKEDLRALSLEERAQRLVSFIAKKPLMDAINDLSDSKKIIHNMRELNQQAIFLKDEKNNNNASVYFQNIQSSHFDPESKPNNALHVLIDACFKQVVEDQKERKDLWGTPLCLTDSKRQDHPALANATNMAMLLVELGVNTIDEQDNFFNQSALAHAIANDMVDLAVYMINKLQKDRDAKDPHPLLQEVAGGDQYKSTPLLLAIQRGQVETVRALLKAGIDPNQRARDLSPLQWAGIMKNKEMMDLLIRYGAKQDYKYDNNTAQDFFNMDAEKFNPYLKQDHQKDPDGKIIALRPGNFVHPEFRQIYAHWYQVERFQQYRESAPQQEQKRQERKKISQHSIFPKKSLDSQPQEPKKLRKPQL